jgi:hypothetical protein
LTASLLIYDATHVAIVLSIPSANLVNVMSKVCAPL